MILIQYLWRKNDSSYQYTSMPTIQDCLFLLLLKKHLFHLLLFCYLPLFYYLLIVLCLVLHIASFVLSWVFHQMFQKIIWIWTQITLCHPSTKGMNSDPLIWGLVFSGAVLHTLSYIPVHAFGFSWDWKYTVTLWILRYIWSHTISKVSY